MSADLVPAAVRTRWLAHRIDAHPVVDSTNARAWILDEDGAPHGTLVVAGGQTAGRGRQGRTWESVPGNLFASVLLRRETVDGHDAALSLVAGLEIAATLRYDLDLDDVGVKWPNDVWLAGRKVAGVLSEARTDARPRVVIGFGVNLRAPDAGWGELEGHATSLDAHGTALTPAAFLEHLLPRLERGLEAFDAAGFATCRDAWTDFDVLAGRTVAYTRGRIAERGRALGVDGSGALRVETEGGAERTLHGGEVHLEELAP